MSSSIIIISQIVSERIVLASNCSSAACPAQLQAENAAPELGLGRAEAERELTIISGDRKIVGQIYRAVVFDSIVCLIIGPRESGERFVQIPHIRQVETFGALLGVDVE